MIWNYILKIKLNNKVIYIKDICTQNKEKHLNVNNNKTCGTLSNEEVLKYARKC
ncbi:hypothetical protein [Clostridium weizhouense]|uniref:Uncharacterized protein n=1 Tax=Clostridium weizhouense TaxID=2859781 RepID=A0ABS7AJG7_9CLOT|nr:hypothetical protein [Clostridium weizhouense]MBW6408798.1 hypothetical protein [Clostridium weizhouense]